MGLDGFFNRLKTKERRGLESKALEQIGLLGSYLLPRDAYGKQEPPLGLKAEFRGAEELLREANDSDGAIRESTREELRAIVERIRESYRLY